jgi:GT2 family glycosyltransferase
VPNRSDGLSLSVIIPSHCRSELLRACLASVIRLAPPGTEIIVVDDASPRCCISRTSAAFAGVHTLRLPRRRGFCAAVNAGLRAAHSAIVELLNDDTEVTAGWAEAALRAFADPRVAAVAPLVLQRADATEGPRIDSAGDRYYLGGIAGKRGHGLPPGGRFLQPGRVFGASASSAFYRRDVLRRIGAFPESFGAYFEDVDVSFRLNRAGFRIRFEPGSRVYHRVSASYGKPQRQLLQQQSRNEERVFWRNVPPPALARALPRHAAVLAGKAWRRWQEGNLLPFLCGRLQVLADVPDLLRHRRELAAMATTDDLTECQVDAHWFGERGL